MQLTYAVCENAAPGLCSEYLAATPDVKRRVADAIKTIDVREYAKELL